MGDMDYTDWGDASFSKVAAPTTKQPSVVNTMPSPKFTWVPGSRANPIPGSAVHLGGCEEMMDRPLVLQFVQQRFARMFPAPH